VTSFRETRHRRIDRYVGPPLFAQVTAERPYTLEWAASPRSKLPLLIGGSGPHLIHYLLGPPEPTTQTESRSVRPFLHNSRQTVPVLYNGRLSSPQNYPFPWGNVDSHLIHGSLGPPQTSNLTASRSVQQFLESTLLCQTDRPTDRLRYSVCNSRRHLRT